MTNVDRAHMPDDDLIFPRLSWSTNRIRLTTNNHQATVARTNWQAIIQQPRSRGKDWRTVGYPEIITIVGVVGRVGTPQVVKHPRYVGRAIITNRWVGMVVVAAPLRRHQKWLAEKGDAYLGQVDRICTRFTERARVEGVKASLECGKLARSRERMEEEGETQIGRGLCGEQWVTIAPPQAHQFSWVWSKSSTYPSHLDSEPALPGGVIFGRQMDGIECSDDQ